MNKVKKPSLEDHVFESIIGSEDFNKMSIEQMYAVRNRLTKHIDDLHHKRAVERDKQFKEELEAIRNRSYE